MKIDDNYKNKDGAEKQKILFFYVLFSLSVSAVFIPNLALSVFSGFIPNIITTTLFAFLISIVILIMIYSEIGKSEEDSLLENHLIHMTRTFWKTSLLFFYFSNISMLYLFLMLDYAPLQTCFNYIQSNVMTIASSANMDMFEAIANLCEKPFYEENTLHLYITAFLAFGIAFIVYLWKTGCGLLSVVNGKVIVPYESIKR